jgi:hypothetical protein
MKVEKIKGEGIGNKTEKNKRGVGTKEAKNR